MGKVAPSSSSTNNSCVKGVSISLHRLHPDPLRCTMQTQLEPIAQTKTEERWRDPEECARTPRGDGAISGHGSDSLKRGRSGKRHSQSRNNETVEGEG